MGQTRLGQDVCKLNRKIKMKNKTIQTNTRGIWFNKFESYLFCLCQWCCEAGQLNEVILDPLYWVTYMLFSNSSQRQNAIFFLNKKGIRSFLECSGYDLRLLKGHGKAYTVKNGVLHAEIVWIWAVLVWAVKRNRTSRKDGVSFLTSNCNICSCNYAGLRSPMICKGQAGDPGELME